MKIKIPDGFFPPPGVPFETSDQRDIAVALHNASLATVQVWNGVKWLTDDQLSGSEIASAYRLAPSKPRTVGPFESVHEHNGLLINGPSKCAWTLANDSALSVGMKRFRVKLTATAEEIL